ncbi:MAG: oxidoreductase [Methylococcaceae bacterium]|nr:MAG: oxidoreductase [Methylococcaceae bacterium]
MRTQVLQHIAPRQVEVRDMALAPPADGEVLLETEYSAISPGTESLIFQGRMPADLPLDATLASLPGTFAYPFAYGYALVGKVIEIGGAVAADWLGKRVFVFHPHQRHVVTPADHCLPIPDDVSSRAALFLPNMESALNFVMDGGPLVGETALVFGQGVVGLLTTAVLASFPLQRLVTLDTLATRRDRALQWGAHESIDPLQPEAWRSLQRSLFPGAGGAEGADVCFELSGNMAAINQAIALSGFAGRIIIGSWYGDASQPLDLGGHFHRRRIQLISSQVSTLHPALSGRWSKPRRLALAWDWLRRIRPDNLVSHEFTFADCRKAFALNSARTDGVLQTIFNYS